MPVEVKAYGSKTFDTRTTLEPLVIKRRDVLPDDVFIDVKYGGVCHSDIHSAFGEWSQHLPEDQQKARYPVIPGHEIVGVVREVGSNVSKFKAGDYVGVGCMVDSCRTCRQCGNKHEEMCKNTVFTYDSPDKHLPGQNTYGGYTTDIVVDQNYVLAIPDALLSQINAVPPLLCAGITTWTPLKQANIVPGMKVGISGLGGLGHMAIKLAKAMGAEVYVFSRSLSKVDDAKRLGATDVIISTDAAAMAAAAGTLDVIIDTVSAPHDLHALLDTLAPFGQLKIVGASPEPYALNAFALITGNKSISASLIGSIKDTDEMLKFCAQHKIVAEVEMINMQDINTAYQRMLKSDVKYRFVIDMESLKKD